MTLEELIFSALGPLVGNRVFPDVAPLATAKPYVTYQVLPGPPVRADSTRWLDGSKTDKRRSVVQLNAWGAGRLAVNALARQLEDAMCAGAAVSDTSFFAEPQTDPRPDHVDVELPDAPQGLFGTIQDFSVISKR